MLGPMSHARAETATIFSQNGLSPNGYGKHKDMFRISPQGFSPNGETRFRHARRVRLARAVGLNSHALFQKPPAQGTQKHAVCLCGISLSGQSARPTQPNLCLTSPRFLHPNVKTRFRSRWCAHVARAAVRQTCTCLLRGCFLRGCLLRGCFTSFDTGSFKAASSFEAVFSDAFVVPPSGLLSSMLPPSGVVCTVCPIMKPFRVRLIFC